MLAEHDEIEGRIIKAQRSSLCFDCGDLIVPGERIARVVRGSGMASDFADEASEGCDAVRAWVHVVACADGRHGG